MGWFDEQIRERIQSDQEILEDSFLQIAGAVLGGRAMALLEDERLAAKEALDDILKYYHYKPVEVPENIRDFDEQMDYVLRPLGLMTREVLLEEGWYKDAYGPMLGLLKDGGAVALLPGAVSGYRFRDPSTGNIRRVDRHTAKLIKPEALCFYRPLPMKSLGIPDLLLYMKNCVSSGDVTLIFLATLCVTLIGMIEPRVYRAVTGPVLDSKSPSLLAGMAIFLLASAFASQLISAVRTLLMDRISTKTSMAVEASVMMRLLSMPMNFFRRFSSGELSSRMDSVSSLCSLLLDNIMSTGLTSILSLLYITEIFRYAPLLVVPSLVIILITVLGSVLTALIQINISREKMQLAAKESGLCYAMISGIRKIRLSGAEKRAFARWGKLYAKNVELEYNPPVILKLNNVIMGGISLVGTIVLYFTAVKSGVSPSEYFAFSAAYGRVMGAFSAMAEIAINVAAIPPVLEMAEPILKTEPEITAEKEVITRLSGNIELNHVSFRYEEGAPYVLNDLSLKIRSGEYVAIVGRTGCGKSTLIRLLLGFEEPDKGAIYYDGRDLKSGRSALSGGYLLQYYDLRSPAVYGGSLGGGGDTRDRRGHPEYADGNAHHHIRGTGRHLRRSETASDDRPRRRAKTQSTYSG